MCSCQMAPTSITSWPKTAGDGGIESMHQSIRSWAASDCGKTIPQLSELYSTISSRLLSGDAPASHFMHTSRHQMLDQVVKNDRDHDSWVRSKGK